MAIFIPLVTRFDPKGLQGAQRALANFQNFAVQVGRVAAAAITAVAVTSVREAVKFESTFAKIEGLVGVTREEIVELQEAAKRLGPEFAASGADAGEALFFITSAGLRGASAVNVLEASLKGAAVGLGDAKTIADLATSAVNAYGESQLDGALAVDVLTNAVRLGKLEPEALAGSMGQVLPLASVLGVRFDEVGAAMAGMSKTGTDAAAASTQLGRIFTTLINPSSQANTQLEKMGMSAEGLREQIREKGLFATLEGLTDAFDGNIEATATVFGNVTALRGVLDLMGESTEENRILFDEMTNSLGVTDEAFEVISDTTEFKFKRAMATARGSLLNIGDAILDNLQPHLNTFQEWIENNGPTIERGFIRIFDAINNFVTSETLANLAKEFQEMLPDLIETAKSLGDIAVALAPILTKTLRDTLPLLKDLASIFNDISFFAAMVAEDLFGIEVSGGNLFDFFTGRFSMMGQIRMAFQAIADAVNAAVTAFARFRQADANFDPANPGPASIGGVLVDPNRDRRDVVPRIAPPRQTLSVRDSLFQDPRAPLTIRGRRGGGGPVSGGAGFLVGEMGPELFIPSDGGNITPNDQLGGTVYNITVNAGMGAGDGAKLGEQIVSAIKRFERSSGKVFVSV